MQSSTAANPQILPESLDAYSAMVWQLPDRFLSGRSRYTTSDVARPGAAAGVAPHIFRRRSSTCDKALQANRNAQSSCLFRERRRAFEKHAQIMRCIKLALTQLQRTPND
jgi:propionate CoA-transferase